MMMMVKMMMILMIVMMMKTMMMMDLEGQQERKETKTLHLLFWKVNN